MRNIWTIYRKELKSYFASPIAYLLMAVFALIFGYFFYVATAIFVQPRHGIADDGPRHADGHERVGDPAAADERQRDRAVHDPHDHHAAVRRGEALRHHRTADDLAGPRHRDHPRQVVRRGDAVREHPGDLGYQPELPVHATASRTGGRF